MFEGIAALLSGGATGLLGTALSFGVEYFQRRQRHQQEVEMRRIDLEIAEREAAGAAAVAAIEAESEESAREWKALEASHETAAVRWSDGDSPALVWVDVVRGLTRPALTWLFLALVAVIYFTLGADEAEIRASIVDTVLYLSSTCVLWWFGARQVGRPRR